MSENGFLQELQWIRLHSPRSQALLHDLKISETARFTVLFHIDDKMVPLLESLASRCQLRILACSQDTTDPRAWDYLKHHTKAEMLGTWGDVPPPKFDDELEYVCDLGGELLANLIREGKSVTAGLEGTTSGLLKLQQLTDSISFPIFDWNNSSLKREVHNRMMVGYSLWHTFTQVTKLSLHGKTVGVMGYGPVGQGIAEQARRLGGFVRVFELDCSRRTLAQFQGFPTPEFVNFLRDSEVLVTATGRAEVLTLKDLEIVKPNCLLLNAGHSETELSAEIRDFAERQSIAKHIESISIQGKNVYLLSRGRLLNLSAGFGDTLNAFDLTLAELVRAIQFVLSPESSRQAGVHSIPH